MAKKKTSDDLGKLNSDVLSEFNLDVPEADTKGRTTAKAAKAVSNVLIGGLSGTAHGVESEIRQRFPNTAGIVDDAIDVASGLRDIGKEAAQEIGTAANTLKGITLKMMPMAKAVVPKKLYNKIENKLKASYVPEEEQKSEEERIAEARNANIESQINSIMEAQSQFAQLNAAQQAAENQAKTVIEHTQFASNQKVFAAIDKKLEFMNMFLSGAFTAYMKKSLELKYKHLYVANDTFQVVKLMSRLMETKLEEIKHNTALPEYAKVTMKERLKGALKEKTVKGVADFVSGFKDKLLGNVKEQVIGNIRGFTRGMLPMLAGVADMSGMMGPLSVSQIAGKAAGGAMGLYAGSKTASKLSEHQQTINDIEQEAGNFKNLLPLMLSKLADKGREKGGILGWLADLVPSYKAESKVKVDDVINDPTATVPFDMSTRAAIVEVIPAHLERIGDFIEGLAKTIAPQGDYTKKAFDFTTHKIGNANEIEENFIAKTVGSQKERAYDISQTLSSTMGMANASKSFTKKQKKAFTQKDFLDAEQKWISNLIASKEYFDPEQYHNFVKNPIQSSMNDYCNKVFKDMDIEAARQIAIYVNGLCYEGENKNFGAIADLTDMINRLQQKYDLTSALHRFGNMMGNVRHSAMIDTQTGDVQNVDTVFNTRYTNERIKKDSEYAEFEARERQARRKARKSRNAENDGSMGIRSDFREKVANVSGMETAVDAMPAWVVWLGQKISDITGKTYDAGKQTIDKISNKVKSTFDDTFIGDTYETTKKAIKIAKGRVSQKITNVYKIDGSNTIIEYDVLASDGGYIKHVICRVNEATDSNTANNPASHEAASIALKKNDPDCDVNSVMNQYDKFVKKAAKSSDWRRDSDQIEFVGEKKASEDKATSKDVHENNFSFKSSNANTISGETNALIGQIITILQKGTGTIKVIPIDGVFPGGPSEPPSEPTEPVNNGPSIPIPLPIGASIETPKDVVDESIPKTGSKTTIWEDIKEIGSKATDAAKKGVKWLKDKSRDLFNKVKDSIPNRNEFLEHIPEKYRDSVAQALDKCNTVKHNLSTFFTNIQKNLGKNKHVAAALKKINTIAETIKDPIERKKFVQEQVKNVCSMYDTIKETVTDPKKRKEALEKAKGKLQDSIDKTLEKLKNKLKESDSTDQSDETQKPKGFFGRVFDWIKNTKIGKALGRLWTTAKTHFKAGWDNTKDKASKLYEKIKTKSAEQKEPVDTEKQDDQVEEKKTVFEKVKESISNTANTIKDRASKLGNAIKEKFSKKEETTSEQTESGDTVSEGSDKTDKMFSGKPESRFHADFRAFATKLFAYIESGKIGGGTRQTFEDALITGIGKAIGGVGKGVGSALKGLYTGYGKVFGGLVKGTGSAIGGIAKSGIPSALIGAAGNVARGAGSMIGGIARGYGKAFSGLVKGVGRAVGPVAKTTISGIGNILFPDWGGSKDNKKSSGFFSKITNLFKPKFIDIYLKDQIDPGNPLLSKKAQEDGVYFEDGSKVEASADIDKPVFGNKPGEEEKSCLITAENINHGLVDVHNNPIGGSSSGSSKKGLLDRLGLPGKVLKWTGKAIGAGFDIWGSLLGLGGKTAKGVIKGCTTMVGRLFGIDGMDFKVHHKGLETRLDKIINILIGYTGIGPDGGPVRTATPQQNGSEASSSATGESTTNSEETPNTEGENSGFFGSVKSWFKESKVGRWFESSRDPNRSSATDNTSQTTSTSAETAGLKQTKSGRYQDVKTGKFVSKEEAKRRMGKDAAGANKKTATVEDHLKKVEENEKRRKELQKERDAEKARADKAAKDRLDALNAKNKGDSGVGGPLGKALDWLGGLLGKAVGKVGSVVGGALKSIGNKLFGKDGWFRKIGGKLFGKTGFFGKIWRKNKARTINFLRKNKLMQKLGGKKVAKWLAGTKKLLSKVNGGNPSSGQTDLFEDAPPPENQTNADIRILANTIANSAMVGANGTTSDDDEGGNEKKSPIKKLTDLVKKTKNGRYRDPKTGKFISKAEALKRMALGGGGEDEDSEGGGIMDTVSDMLGKKAPGRGTYARKAKALWKVASRKFGSTKFGHALKAFGGKASAFGKAAGSKFLGAAGKLAGKVGLKGLGSKIAGSALMKGIGSKLAGSALAKGGAALLGKVGLTSALGSLGSAGAAAGAAGAAGGAAAGAGGIAALVSNPVGWAVAAGLLASYAGFKGIKGASKAATKKNLDIKEGVQVQDRFASGISQALTLGFGGKKAAKFTRKALHWMPSVYGMTIGLTKAIMGDKEAMSDAEIQKFRKKCEQNIKKGMKGYDTILAKFNKAVRTEDWPLARSISGNEKELWKDLFWAPIQQVKDIKNLFFGNDEKPMTAGEVKAFRKKMEATIKKDKNKVAEQILKRFDDAVEQGDWKQARKLSGKEATGLLNGPNAGRNIGMLFGGPVGMLIGDLFDDPNNKPLSKGEIKKTQDFLQKQAITNPKARDILERFNTAVEGGDWKTARKLSSKEGQYLITKMFKAGLVMNRIAAAIVTGGTSEVLLGFMGDQDTPMTEKEITVFRNRMMNRIKKKKDRFASQQLEAFDEAVARQNWSKARKISKVKHEGWAMRATKWVVKQRNAYLRNYTLLGLFMDNDNSKPMTEEEQNKFRDSMERKIKLGDKKAQKKLDAFNDAVAEERWERARHIAKLPNENTVKTAFKAVDTFFDNLVGSADKMAMTELEIKKARDAFQDRIKAGDPKAEKLLAKFDDAVGDEDWKRARRIAGVKATNWLKKGIKAYTEFWWSGDQDSSMTEAEVQAFENKMNDAIKSGDKTAQKRLDEFHEAIGNGLWAKARRISDTKADGVYKKIGKGIANLFKKSWLGQLLGLKEDVDPNEVEDLRKKLEDKVNEEDNPGWQKVYDRFVQLMNNNMYREAKEYGEQILENGIDSDVGKQMVRESHTSEDLVDMMKLTARQKDVIANIDKSYNNTSWWHFIDKTRLAMLSRSVKNADPTTGELTEEFLDEAEDQLKDIDENAETTEDKDYGDPSQEKIIKAQVRLRDKIIELRDTEYNNYWKHPIDYWRVRWLASQITGKMPGDVTDEDIGKWHEEVLEFVPEEKPSPEELEDFMARQKEIGENIDKSYDKISWFEHPIDKARLAILSKMVKNIPTEELSEKRLDEYEGKLVDIDPDAALSSKDKKKDTDAEREGIAERIEKIIENTETAYNNIGWTHPIEKLKMLLISRKAKALDFEKATNKELDSFEDNINPDYYSKVGKITKPEKSSGEESGDSPSESDASKESDSDDSGGGFFDRIKGFFKRKSDTDGTAVESPGGAIAQPSDNPNSSDQNQPMGGVSERQEYSAQSKYGCMMPENGESQEDYEKRLSAINSRTGGNLKSIYSEEGRTQYKSAREAFEENYDPETDPVLLNTALKPLHSGVVDFIKAKSGVIKSLHSGALDPSDEKLLAAGLITEEEYKEREKLKHRENDELIDTYHWMTNAGNQFANLGDDCQSMIDMCQAYQDFQSGKISRKEFRKIYENYIEYIKEGNRQLRKAPGYAKVGVDTAKIATRFAGQEFKRGEILDGLRHLGQGVGYATSGIAKSGYNYVAGGLNTVADKASTVGMHLSLLPTAIAHPIDAFNYYFGSDDEPEQKDKSKTEMHSGLFDFVKSVGIQAKQDADQHLGMAGPHSISGGFRGSTLGKALGFGNTPKRSEEELSDDVKALEALIPLFQERGISKEDSEKFSEILEHMKSNNWTRPDKECLDYLYAKYLPDKYSQDIKELDPKQYMQEHDLLAYANLHPDQFSPEELQNIDRIARTRAFGNGQSWFKAAWNLSENHEQRIKDNSFIDNINERIKPLHSGFFNFIKDKAKSIKNGISTGASWLKDKMSPVMSDISARASWLKDKALFPFRKIKDGVKSLTNPLINSFRQLPFESAISLDKAGRLVDFAKGSLFGVDARMPKNGTVIHNHPDGSPVSQTDIQSAKEAGVKSIVTLTPDSINDSIVKPVSSGLFEAVSNLGSKIVPGLVKPLLRSDQIMNQVNSQMALRESNRAIMGRETTNLQQNINNIASDESNATREQTQVLGGKLDELISATFDVRDATVQGANLTGERINDSQKQAIAQSAAFTASSVGSVKPKPQPPRPKTSPINLLRSVFA